MAAVERRAAYLVGSEYYGSWRSLRVHGRRMSDPFQTYREELLKPSSPSVSAIRFMPKVGAISREASGLSTSLEVTILRRGPSRFLTAAGGILFALLHRRL
jgi:hypothetical protein